MTAISITAPAPPLPHATAPHRARSPHPRRRWRRFPRSIALSLAVISGGGALASRDTGAPAGSFSDGHRRRPANRCGRSPKQVAPGADPRDVVDAIVRLNALDGVTVSAGQRLSIPAEYAAPPSRDRPRRHATRVGDASAASTHGRGEYSPRRPAPPRRPPRHDALRRAAGRAARRAERQREHASGSRRRSPTTSWMPSPSRCAM